MHALAPSKGVEKVNKVVGSIVSIILLLSFAMGIYCAGTNKTYDFKKHLESIAEVAEEMVTFETLADIWDDDDFRPKKYGMKYSYPHTSMNDALGSVNAYSYITHDNYDWGMFQPVHETMNTIGLTGYKITYTFQFLGKFIAGMFQLAFKLSPTSGIVERGAI